MTEYVSVIKNPHFLEEVSEGGARLREMIRTSSQFKGWTLYEQPMLNSMQPDLILAHPHKGILLIQVKDWSLTEPEYMEDGQVLGAHGDYFTDNPVQQVTAYKDLLLKYELDTFLEAVEAHGEKAFEMITPVIYFHEATREDAVRFVGNASLEECFVWSKADVDELCRGDANRDDERFPSAIFIDRPKFSRGPEHSMGKLVANLDEIIRPGDYSLLSQRPLTLTGEQNKLVPIQRGSIRRWGGVAGSGKTVVLATKAAEALQAGQRVLVLTYNITLRHYVRDLCSRQFTGLDRSLLKSHLTVAHFHGFLKIILAELSMRVPSGSVEDYPEWAMELVLEKINPSFPKHLRYDSILIDEGQDFTGDWIRFLKNVYTYDGELLVMYDEAQRMFADTGVWMTDPDEIDGIGFRGQVGHLSTSQRLPSGIVHQIDRLSGVFGIEKKLNATSEQIDLFTDISWKNIDATEDRLTLVQNKVDAILAQNISSADITVITMRESTGIEMVRAFEKAGRKVSHVYDLNGTKQDAWMFQPGKNRLKVSSYHRYKGWESSHVILLLEAVGSEDERWKNMLDALYLSLTRVRAFSNARSFTCMNSCPEFNAIESYFLES